MGELSFFCFSTLKNKYMYVRNVNSIVRLSNEEYEELLKVKRGCNNNSWVVDKYKKLGLFIDNPVKKIEHPNTELLGYEAKYLCQQLTLQVTQQCNLRCEYCAYSGLYKNRVHENKHMDFSIAKKAIDFFINNSRESKSLAFGFYGGEPLLRFPLIKQCINYIEEKIEGKEIIYAITTNGTLLSDEVVDFFVEHNVLLSISLDGEKEAHDIHRKFISGKGSFDVIIKNVERLKQRYPDYGKKVRFLPVISPNANLGKILNYFSKDEAVKENTTVYSLVSTIGLKEKLEEKEGYDIREFQLTYSYEYLKLLMVLAGKLDKNNVSELGSTIKIHLDRFYNRIRSHDQIGETVHHGGPCMPGVARLFVTVDGDFYPCEKVSELNPDCCIGNINDGFNMKRMEDILNIGELTKEECRNCWNLANCVICAANLEVKEGGFCKKDKLNVCQKQKDEAKTFIYEIAVLNEFGYGKEREGVGFYE